ncbi:glycosyltransferase [Aureimonas sp. AU12]|uniref:glycosyltransferase n=1 Tax=Aureimonas sp. AU12 TaxID=1638161 RepID=UPI0007814A93|nr:glycosyltransferase [Aureimonas sp. AU12]
MTHYALICPPFHSHVRVFEAIGEALLARGHRVTFVVNAGAGALVRAAGIEVEEVEERGWRTLEARREPGGLFGILRTVRDGAERTAALCEGGPAILRRIGAEALLGDQMEPAAGLLAEHLALPFLSVASALPIDPDPSLPSPFVGWRYDPTPEGLKRNRGGERISRLLLHRQREAIRVAALEFGLPPRDRMDECLSPLATLAQTVPGFDFPRRASARHFALGPFRTGADALAPSLVLPFERRPGAPLVFASLGTLQGHRVAIFRAVARACRALGCQLVVAHCGRLGAADAASIEADFVTDFVPQRAMMREADICVSHAGLNTVLDALEAGVPVLAVPIGYDQPGVAARLVHHGVGLRLRRRRLTASTLEAALARLIGEASFARNAAAIGAEIAASGGAAAAAEIAERLAGAPARPRRALEPA